MRKTTFIIALLASSAAHGQMFKCTDPATGRTIFSQTQCATEAQSIDVDVHRPSADQIEAHRQRVETHRQMIEDGIDRRRAMRIEANRRLYEAELAAEHQRTLAEIQANRARANNNQAGATYLHALSQDEANANARYEAELERLRGGR